MEKAIWCLLTYFIGVASLAERKRSLEGETEYATARMVDIEREVSSTLVQRGKKRKQEDCPWMAEGKSLVKKSQCLLGKVGGLRTSFMAAKTRWDAYRLVSAFKVHDQDGDLLLRQAFYDARGPCHGYHIPVKQLVGREVTFDHLKVLLDGDMAGRIAVHGIEGIGKTFLMKHLNNYALNRFAYVFWVSCPDVFTIKNVQDAVARVVNCVFGGDDPLFVRARKLSDTLANLGKFVLFLDGIPKADFTLEEVGIPVPANGSKCKLVLSTSSALDCRMFDSCETVEIKCLPNEDAYELFMREANIGEGLVASLNSVPSSLADKCEGVPRTIVNVATRMSGIDDLHEWRHAFYKLGEACPFPLRKSETALSTRKVRSNKNSIEQ